MKHPAHGLPRVFIGTVEIAGHYSGLARALRGIGVDAVAVDLGRHPYRYDAVGLRHPVVRLVAAITSRAQRPYGARLVSAFWRALEPFARALLLAWTLVRFDAFIFGFGTTILYGRELPLLRRLGKRIVFVFNGSDARPPYVDGAEMAASLGRTVDDCVRLARRKKTRIHRIERHAHAIVSQPTFSHFFERPVVDFFRLGVPWTPPPPVQQQWKRTGVIRILHSPSHPEVKGSQRIRETIAELQAAGLPVQLTELHGVPNDAVRSEIARSDLVIDQLYSDAPMVGFATEAATAGVPAIVGGYAWPELRRIYPDDLMPPVEQCHPDELADAIRRVAEDPDHRRSLGERARQFVEERWAPNQVAERYLAVLLGEFPAEWLFDPHTLDYVRGVGLTEDRARDLVRGVLEHGGREALQLADKPGLEESFIMFGKPR